MRRAANPPIVTPASAPDGFVQMFVGHRVTPRHDNDAPPRIAAAVVVTLLGQQQPAGPPCRLLIVGVAQ